MCGCEGREHRTGYCRTCSLRDPRGVVVEGIELPNSTRPVMVNGLSAAQVAGLPLLWEGDDN